MMTTERQIEATTYVRDPICGMTFPDSQARVMRTIDNEAVYFCSNHCAEQFDEQHACSATTGVVPPAVAMETLQWIELPLMPASGTTGIDSLKAHVIALAGVQHVIVNPNGTLLRVLFDPASASPATIIAGARAAGYSVGAASVVLPIKGIDCASCVVTIEQALHRTAGVIDATVNPATEQAHIQYQPGLVDLAGLTRTIEDAGYQVRAPKSPSPQEESPLDREEFDREQEYHTLLRKFWFAVAISAPVLLFSYPQFCQD